MQDTVKSLGMQSLSQPSVHIHVSRMLKVVAHVDDFVSAGPEEKLRMLYDGLGDKIESARLLS